MDRVSRIGSIVCVVLLVGVFFLSNPKPRPAPPAAPVAPSTPVAVNSLAATTNTPAPASSPAGTAPAANAAAPLTTPTSALAPVAEKITLLENASIRATLTSRGAAIREVELKKQKLDKTSNIVLNTESRSNILQVTGWVGADGLDFQSRAIPNGVVYTATLPGGVTWERSYTLGADYILAVKDVFTNPGAAETVLPAYGLSVGRAQPLLVSGRMQGNSSYFLGCGWLTSKSYHLTTISNFNPSYIPLVGIKTGPERAAFASTEQDPNPLRWLGAENQFFTVLLTPTEDHLITSGQFTCFNQRDATGRLMPPDAVPDIEATAQFPEIHVPAGGKASLDYTLYAGPKDYDRLNALGERQGELMNYDGWLPFSLIIVPMLWLLHMYHSFVGNYGVAIILLTLTVKIITWPLQSVANHNGKKMQALAPKLKELQAKYKEQPEKLNTEMFGLYRDYGVNPFGGCLPALVQMPVFIGLYTMLQNAGELRGQSFLWVHDLTQPDTVVMLPFLHLGLNPLPLMVTGLTMVMMRMTPQIGDPQQAKIAQIMPLFFLFLFYNFAAALSLYYVVNNCVSILQIYRNLRKPLPELKRKPKPGK